MIVVGVLLLVVLRLMIGGLMALKTSWPRFNLIGVPAAFVFVVEKNDDRVTTSALKPFNYMLCKNSRRCVMGKNLNALMKSLLKKILHKSLQFRYWLMLLLLLLFIPFISKAWFRES
jgi:hypothetical protein